MNLKFSPGTFIHLIFSSLFMMATACTRPPQSVNLWEEGTGDYASYRIPSLIVTGRGTLLAFAEGRNEHGDAGDIDLLMRRSEDNGHTWSGQQVIWDDRKNTCGNPTPVLDRNTGRICLLMTWNRGVDTEADIISKTAGDTRRVFVTRSDDDGVSWSLPEELTPTCKDPDWGWYATGPGIGIQLERGNHKGRLVIPANHSYDQPDGKHFGKYGYGAHVLISDDHGLSWRMGGVIRPEVNESQLFECTDGTLVMNMRSYNGQHCRAVSFSSDGGETWSAVMHDYQLVESQCQASILNYGSYSDKTMVLFSNPAVPVGRSHLTVRVSTDEAGTWVISRLVFAGPSAYSCLARLPDGNIGLLFEAGVRNPYETIKFISFPVNKLFSGGELVR